MSTKQQYRQMWLQYRGPSHMVIERNDLPIKTLSFLQHMRFVFQPGDLEESIKNFKSVWFPDYEDQREDWKGKRESNRPIELKYGFGGSHMYLVAKDHARFGIKRVAIVYFEEIHSCGEVGK